jgi:hypothetical protein
MSGPTQDPGTGGYAVTPGLVCTSCGCFKGTCTCQGKCPICGRFRIECGGCKKEEGPKSSRERTPREKVRDQFRLPKVPKIKGGPARTDPKTGLPIGDFCGECGMPQTECTCWASGVNDLIELYEKLRGKRKTRWNRLLRGMLVKRILALLEAMSPSERSEHSFSPDYGDRMWTPR